MCSEKHLKFPSKSPVACSPFGAALAALLAIALFCAPAALAQANGSDQQQSQPNQKQQDQVPAEAGGPGGESGSIAVPKKGNTEEPPPPPKPKPTDIPQFSLHVDVPVVTVDAQILQKSGLPIDLPVEQAQEHFKIWEDGVPQKIQSVTKSKAPITAVLLVEFAATNYNFMIDALNGSYAFASMLQPQDWIGIVYFDVKPHVLLDFTQNKDSVFQALNTLRIPGFSETDIFDSMYDTLDRLDRIPGHKELVVIASGRDTFSKITLDQTIKKIKGTPNVTIYTVCTGEAFIEFMQARGGGSFGMSNYLLDYAQAKNQMAAFARMTGGRTYAPRQLGEFPDIFREIAGTIRDQYTITYKPTNTKQDGTYRKLRVELVGPDDKPLVIKDQKNKDIKYTVLAREGYTAKHEVE
jgi:VWFA-related protein